MPAALTKHSCEDRYQVMKAEQIHLCHDKLLPELLDLQLVALGCECLELLNTCQQL